MRLRRKKSHYDYFHGWGRKRSGYKATRLKNKYGAVLDLQEDGFLRSVERSDQALSIVHDDVGIYYDATSPSKIEDLIQSELSSEQNIRATKLINKWKSLRLSKYNSAREYKGALPERYVLVIDQVVGDLSVEYGLASKESFHRMLGAALSEHPDARVVLKVHPDVYTCKKSGYFNISDVLQNDRILVIAEHCHPVRLIEYAEAVYCVTSQVGFEALIWGKRVRCFGMPFYGGWGLTDDELPASERRGEASIEQLVHAALVVYPRYHHPETGQSCEVEAVMKHVSFQRKMRIRFPLKVYAMGFSAWKKPILKKFLRGSRVQYVRHARRVPADGTLVVWGAETPVGIPDGVKLLRVEDGFIRSFGLGAELVMPSSWVIDQEGIYYNPTHSSELERILLESSFDDAIIERARRLREKIVLQRISKYNLKGSNWERPEGAFRVILIPGQVEMDASIRFGAPADATNIGLLKRVREHHPDAYIVYKPHPDVVAKLRKKGVGEEQVADWCDEVVEDGDIVCMLDQVDEVHTWTSLTGFEALLREVDVTCYGQPFYAGWGLTNDLMPSLRRSRELHLDELVAGTLIVYSIYISRITNHFTTPERLLHELGELHQPAASWVSLLRGLLVKGLRIWVASGWKRNA
jgi:capsular polysaccharide export protein